MSRPGNGALGKPEHESQGGQRSDVPRDGRLSTLLSWKRLKYSWEATIGDFEAGDGVRFSLEEYPTCYRRGPWKLMIEVADGPGHIKWGCFDHQDAPLRWYHLESSARLEAEAIAQVLQADRKQRS